MEKSLVADYSGSESEDDEDDGGHQSSKTVKTDGSFLTAGTANVEDDDSSSENSDEDDDDLKDSNSSRSAPQPRLALDNPFRNCEENKVKKEDSVFQIPFREQEKQESAALERHVKMTPLVGTQLTINGKKICWNYRKGKCRFGHNCAFAHDSDIITPVEDTNTTNKTKPISTGTSAASVLLLPTKKETPCFDDQAYISSGAQLGGRKQKQKPVENSDDEFEPEPPQEAPRSGIGKFGKRRPGLSQTLVPGKKVMKNYFDQKNNKQ